MVGKSSRFGFIWPGIVDEDAARKAAAYGAAMALFSGVHEAGGRRVKRFPACLLFRRALVGLGAERSSFLYCSPA